MQNAARRRRRLVDSMHQVGALSDPRWIDAFSQVPRHVFVPRFFLPGDRGWTAVDRHDTGWLDAVYSDRVLVTQLDEDPARWRSARLAGPVPGTPTSSSSMPSIMAIMLEELRVTEGNGVLEVGTGTGYNAALLCHRLGSANVSTIDIDPLLRDQARNRLADCGYFPACAACDGADGLPADAPYDRVLCTCAVSVIPTSWLDQTVPGGLIVTTLNRPLGAGLVRVVVSRKGNGYGRVLARDGRFMPLRAHRMASTGRLLAAVRHEAAQTRPTDLSIRTVLNPGSRFEFFAGLVLPQAAPAVDPDEPEATFLVHPDGSWIRHESEDSRHLVTQGGPRRLWDLLEQGYQDWQELGGPDRDRFGLTVARDHQRIWLDEPASAHSWPL
jgi:methyltransferase of ATP-grasp peptide maturase system